MVNYLFKGWGGLKYIHCIAQNAALFVDLSWNIFLIKYTTLSLMKHKGSPFVRQCYSSFFFSFPPREENEGEEKIIVTKVTLYDCPIFLLYNTFFILYKRLYSFYN